MADVADRSVEVSGLRVHLVEAGAGAPVLVLHQHNGPLWTPFHERLAEDAAVIAPHMPGYGLSERPAWARHPRDEAILLSQLCVELELERVHLVGLGFGGWVAAELATMNQRLLHTLTLVAPSGLQPREGEILDFTLVGFSEELQLGFQDKRLFDELFGPEPAKETMDVWDFSREMTARLSWKPWQFSHQLPGLLPGVRTPALVVHGEADRIFPAGIGRRYAELLPNARLELVEDGGHNLELERSDELAALVSEFALTAVGR